MGAQVQYDALYGYAYRSNGVIAADGTVRYTGGALLEPDELGSPLRLFAGAAARRLGLTLTAQDEWTVLESLTVLVGFRFDAVQLPVSDARNVFTPTLVPALNPRAGLAWSVTDAVALRLLYSRSLRAPTVQELAETIPAHGFNRGRFEGNPELVLATVDAVELGVDWLGAVGDGHVRFAGGAFYDSYLNPIARVDTTGTSAPLRNRVPGVRAFGLEGEGQLELSARTRFWVNASWFRAEDLETPEPFRLITDVPQARFNIGATLPVGEHLNLDLLARFSSERRNNSRSVLEHVRRYTLPGQTIIGAQLRTEPLAGHFELALLGQNVFSQRYADDAPQPERLPGLVPREGAAAYLLGRVSY